MFSSQEMSLGIKIRNLRARALFIYQYAQLLGALVYKDKELRDAFFVVVNKRLDCLQYPLSQEDYLIEDRKIKEIADSLKLVSNMEMPDDSRKILFDFCKFNIRALDDNNTIDDKQNKAILFIGLLHKDGKISEDNINKAENDWYQKPKEYIHYKELFSLERRFDTGEYEITCGEFFIFTKHDDESHKSKLWKIHVSVARDQIAKAWDAIIPMLIHYQIAQFKLTNYSVIEEKLRLTEVKLADAIHNNKPQEQIQKLDNLLRLQREDCKRVSEGMQITIYVPEGEQDDPKYKSLLEQIEVTLESRRIQAGIMDAATDTRIGKFCSARYCKGEYADSTKVKQYKPDDVQDPAFVIQGKKASVSTEIKRI